MRMKEVLQDLIDRVIQEIDDHPITTSADKHKSLIDIGLALYKCNVYVCVCLVC